MPTLLRSLLLVCSVSLLLTSTGCQAIQRLRGETPRRHAGLMEDPNSPDNRRMGIMALVRHEFAQREPYTTRYRQIFQSDPSPLVRATALRALNISRDRGATDLYIQALGDEYILIRLEGAKALRNMPDPAAVDPLLRVLNSSDENQDVRIAAAAALRHYPRRDVARALAGVLGERMFGIAWQARYSLRRITGADYAYDTRAWIEHIDNPDQPLS